ASALSKEYGLAFAVGIAAYALLERRRAILLGAVAGATAYVGARWVFATGATALYCEYMGYFFSVRKVCYDGINATGLGQMTYNVVATAIGPVLPGVLDPVGRIAPAPIKLLASVGFLAIAVLGWRRGPKTLRLASLVIVANTLLNFMLYNGRNQIISVC